MEVDVEKNVRDLALGERKSSVARTGEQAEPAYSYDAYDALQDLLQPRGPSLRDFLNLLKKRKRIILSTALIVFTLGVMYVMSTDDQYTAIATLEIKGYSPVLGEGELETLLQNDTRKLLYQTTTIAKLEQLGLADEVLGHDDLGLAVRDYFKKNRSRYSKLSASFWAKLGFAKKDSHLDEEDPRYTHKQPFLLRYLKLIDVNPIHETSLVQVRATTNNNRLSQRIANSHAEGLIRHLATQRRNELNSHVASLKAHADELQEKLARAEREVTEYANQHQLVGLGDGATGNLTLSHLTDLNKLISGAQAQRAEAEGNVKKMLEENRPETVNLFDDETVKDLRTKLKEAESEYSALSKLVTGEYPKLLELGGKIDALRKTIRTERAGNVSALQVKYQSAMMAEKALVTQFEDQLKKAQAISTELVKYNLLQREAASLRELTQAVLKSLSQTEITSSNDSSDVSISDYAPLPRVPSAPRRGVVVVLSAFLGTILAIGLAILLELLDSTIKVSDEAQAALGLPTLGIIPSFRALDAQNLLESEGWRAKIAKHLPWRQPRSGSLTPVQMPSQIQVSEVGAESQDQDEPVLAATDGPDSENAAPASEGPRTEAGGTVVTARTADSEVALPRAGVLDALRTLRANILFSSTQNTNRVILVASGREREGKTSVITNLAITFARASHRTLLIDADLRRPKVGRRFGIPEDQVGLVDYLAGQATLDEILCPSPVANLTIIPAGSPTVDPTELLGSDEMGALIASLQERFDVTFLDAAPVLPVADSLILSQLAETVIFVVRSGRTEKSVAQEAVKRLRRVGARVRGIVLNDFNPSEGGYSSDRYSVSRYQTLPNKGKMVAAAGNRRVRESAGSADTSPPSEAPADRIMNS